MDHRSVILTFHGIGDPTRSFWPREEAYWVQRGFFEAVLDDIKGRDDTLVTFDDCNASDFETALPELQARGMKAHFYIVWDFIGKPGFLAAAEVKALHAAGMIIGNHGKRHRSWRGLTEGELEDELVEAKDCLENLISDKVRYAACPNGSYDRRVLNRLRASGYERVYTSDRGWAHRSSWLQARNSLLASDDLADVRRIVSSSPFSGEGLVRICKRAIKRYR
jgi:peptidoglycan/xylan/chitin deacetylase (PgdA/CDA1 family)